MVNIAIPLKAESALTASPNTYSWFVDMNYKIFTARLMSFSIPNAWLDSEVDYSQAERWLCNLGSRNDQNNNWNTLFSLATFAGTGALEVFSTTRTFISSIALVNYAQVKFAVFENTTTEKCVTIDTTNKRISAITVSANASAIITWTQSSKWYIVTNTNKFLIICDWNVIKSVPVDANWNIIAWTINTATYSSKCNVACALNQYVWIVWWDTVSFFWQLYSVSSAWVLSTVWASQTLYTHNWSVNDSQSFWSYVKNTTCYFFVSAQQDLSWSSWWRRTIANLASTINMSTVTAFTYTNRKTMAIPQYTVDTTVNANNRRFVPVWFDGTNILIVYANVICTITSWWVYTNTTIVPTTDWYIRYRNSTAKMIDSTINFWSLSTRDMFNYKSKLRLWFKDNIIYYHVFVHEMSWSNEEDDDVTLKRLVCQNAIWYPDWLSFTINWTEVASDMTVSTWQYRTLIWWYTPVANTHFLKFWLSVTNSLAKTLKIWFWITWWTYSAPTGVNGWSWNATTWRTAWNSYMDIVLS